ncbi:hypothetical protein pb186bvf_006407 [Paramecium bursaria]
MNQLLKSNSELLVDHCSSMETPEGIEEFQFKIEEWFYQKNKTLLIREDDGHDLPCMLVHWNNLHLQRNKDLIIPYFVEHENQNYYYAIYYLLIKLRACLSINQKVEIEGQKLKQYFEYWLNLCQRELVNQVFNEQSKTYIRIIIILQGVDNFKDENGEVRVSSWLPKQFPDSIRLIVSAKKSSKAYEYYHSQGATIMTLDDDLERIVEVMKKNNQLYLTYMDVQEKLRKQYKFSKYFIMLLNNQQEEYTSVINLIKQQTFSNFIQICTSSYLQIFNTEAQQQLLQIFNLIHKGLSEQEIVKICQTDETQLHLFINFFKPCLLEFDGFFRIYILELKDSIIISQNLYKRYIKILEHQPNSHRRLLELTYHNYKLKRYFKLKELIINVENFLILWNPYNKFELCHFWEILEQNGYDLVNEYNKGIEHFQALYRPQSEALFLIMLQICRFLREFSNFETDKTPDYRHPQLKGQQSEYQDVGLYQELKQHKMIAKKRQNQPPQNSEYYQSVDNLNFDIRSNRENFVKLTLDLFDPAIRDEFIQTNQEYLLDKLLKSDRENQNYYYKRWIWTQFPWLCLTTKSNFSDMMQYYSNDTTQYMTIQEEGKLNKKAIQFLQQAKLIKSEKSFIVNVSKLPRIQSGIRLRFYSPLDQQNRTKINTSRDRSPNEANKSFKLPQMKQSYLKQLDSLQYQNRVLEKRLKELNTVIENLFPQEISPEAQRIVQKLEELKQEMDKQQESLKLVQQEMKRVAVIWKLCQVNQDDNEENAKELGRYSQGLAKMIQEQNESIKECDQEIIRIKLQKNQLIKPIEERKKPIVKIQFEQSLNNTKLEIKKDIELLTTFRQGSPRNVIAQLKSKSTRVIESNYRGQEQDKLTVIHNQIQALQLDPTYHNQNLIEFCLQLQKNKDLQVSISDLELRMDALQMKKQKFKTILKIHQKNYRPMSIDQKQQVEEIENIQRNNDKKVQDLKEIEKLKSEQSMFVFNLAIILKMDLKSNFKQVYQKIIELKNN